MPRVPLIGRLNPWEYLALIGSLVLIFLESVIRTITLAIPGPIINLCYRSSRRLFDSLSSSQGRRSRNKKKAIVSSIGQANDFLELCDLFGYYAEEHIVQTTDGYLLGLHRLGWRHGEEGERVNSGDGTTKKRVVYLHHGLMMNSDVWVCLTEKERSLPFMLVEKGYDVWLGNNRGNKYSKKSLREPPTSTRFWDFSIDQFAFHDIPDSISYILSTTNAPSLSYIGFSQGTAQAFAALSIHPPLNTQVDVFIALAPAMSPAGLTSGIVDALVKATPEVLFLAFGRRALLTSAMMWQAILYPPIFVRFIDLSLSFLFGWQAKNITPHQKLAAYPHLYSFSSVKSVVHWFQIIRTGKFQMYDDEVQGPFSIADNSKYQKVARFPTRNIKTPIVLVYGGSDSLVDINVMLKELPKDTVTFEVPHYEHLDFLWAGDVDTEVFPVVFDALDATHGDNSNIGGSKSQLRLPSTDGRRRDLPKNGDDYTASDTDNPGPSVPRKITENIPPGNNSNHQKSPAEKDFSASAGHSPTPRQLHHSRLPISSGSPAASANQSYLTTGTSHSRPEGWWSSDEVVGTEPSTPAETPDTHRYRLGMPDHEKLHPTEAEANEKKVRRQGSLRSLNNSSSEAVFGQRGISLGAGKAVGGLSRETGTGLAVVGGSGSEGKRKRKKRREVS
ncbi:alpha/beta-hydrolase [Aulographum hederae CBS 113979]|uniref:Alpha/beta-hydrolase n=1 Tax=Aulographum hederae CBS 113979 TaxID=1176131 RepID=A0A6G1H637_9PEZI|nr:alpha/beta-hydrolase [Aulographum hederae CBS 113979]